MDYRLERSGENPVPCSIRPPSSRGVATMSGYRTRGSDRRLAARRPPRTRGNLPRQSMPRNWEFYNIFGSEPVSAERQPGAGRSEERGEGTTGKKGRERRLRRWVIRLGYHGGPAASREDGYPLFESRNAPDEKCTRLKFTAAKRVRAIWKHTKL